MVKIDLTANVATYSSSCSQHWFHRMFSLLCQAYLLLEKQKETLFTKLGSGDTLNVRTAYLCF